MSQPVTVRWTPYADDIKQDILDWWRLDPPKARRRERWICRAALAFGVLALGLRQDFVPSAGFVAFVALAAGLFGFDRFAVLVAARRVQRTQGTLDTTEVVADEDGIILRQDGEEHSWRWDRVRAFKGRDRILLVMADGGGFVAVPNRALGRETASRLLELAGTQAGGR